MGTFVVPLMSRNNLGFFQGFLEVFLQNHFSWLLGSPRKQHLCKPHSSVMSSENVGGGEEVINKNKSVWEDSSICRQHCAHLNHALVVGEEGLYFLSSAKYSLPVCLHPLMVLLGESWFSRSKSFHIHILLNNVMEHLSSLAKWQISVCLISHRVCCIINLISLGKLREPVSIDEVEFYRSVHHPY